MIKRSLTSDLPPSGLGPPLPSCGPRPGGGGLGLRPGPRGGGGGLLPPLDGGGGGGGGGLRPGPGGPPNLPPGGGGGL